MHASNLQLSRYFLTAFNYSANSDFDLDKNPVFSFSDISVKHEQLLLNKEDLRNWQVTLKVEYHPSADNNAPYNFSAELVGLFRVSKNVEDDKINFYVKTNATSVLYSTLREIVYSMTAKGPYLALLLPTVSFYKDETNE